MRISNKTKFNLIGLSIFLNIILRFQAVSQEIGIDSFQMHVMINSLSEFGYAKWIIHPLSVIGLYPGSYTSTMHFLISGISQIAELDTKSVIFLYNAIIGTLSMFTAYLMAQEILDNDIFKLITALSFSITPAILSYSTWVMPARGIFIVLAPLYIYLVLKSRCSIKYALLFFIITFFLFATHHLFYFLIPSLFALLLIIGYQKFKQFDKYIKFPSNFMPLFIIVSFALMFSIPFFTGRFLESSRYSSFFYSYIRYIGPLIIPAIGGLGYVIFKENKSFGELLLLINLIFLMMFINLQTYMKWFLPIFIVPLASMGMINILKQSNHRKYGYWMVIIFVVSSCVLSGYYQFLHTYDESQFNKRYIEEETYITGKWMKTNINGYSISNDVIFSQRIFSASETAHILTNVGVVNLIYGFINIDISDFKMYPITTEDFWFTGYAGPDLAEIQWEEVNMLRIPVSDLNITYFVENTNVNGNLEWGHASKPSKLLQRAYGRDNLVYNSGKVSIWDI